MAGGTTLLLTTQYLDEADRLADRICVINGGRVTAEGTPAELKASFGSSHLLLTVTSAESLTTAAGVVSGYAAGPIGRLDSRNALAIPVIPRAGLITNVVRALDAASIGIDDLTLRHPSLDDVFHALTAPAAAGTAR